MAYFIGAQLSQVSLTMKQTLRKFEDLEEEQQEVDEQKGSSGQARQIKRWKTKQGVFQLKAPVAMDQVEPNPGDSCYAEVLRDV